MPKTSLYDDDLSLVLSLLVLLSVSVNSLFQSRMIVITAKFPSIETLY